MEKRKLKRWMTPSPVVLVVVVAVLIVVCLYAFYLRDTFLKETEQTIGQHSRLVAAGLDTKLRFAESSIREMSFAISKRMDSPVLRYPNTMIQPMLRKTPFSKVEYVSGEGISIVDGGEPFDASDREYFQQGIRGKTGVWINYMSHNSAEAQVNVYTPLLFRDSIVGVLTGVLGGKSDLRPILEYQILGEDMVTLLCDRHMNIVASSIDDGDYGRSFEIRSAEFISPQIFNLFRQNAVSDNSRAFRFSTEAGESIASVAKVPGTGWFVVEMLPYHVLTSYTRRITVSAMAAVLLVAIFFGIYIYSVYRANRRIRNEVEGRHLNVINALTESYGSAFEVNLNTGHMVVYRVNANVMRFFRDIADQEVLYDQLMMMYLKRMVLPEDRSLFERVLTLDVLRRTFIKQDRIEFTYRIQAGEDIHYLQAHYVKPSKERPEFVAGFKLFDDFMAAELEKRKELNEQRMALVQALEKARLADKVKSNFLFSMSHDIRTPMNAVLGYEALSRRLLQNLDLPDGKGAVLLHYFDNIKKAGDCLLELINSVLNMARVESGVVALDEAPILIDEVTDKLVATFEQDALQKNILMQVSRNFKNHYVYADKVKIQQVLQNIVGNAIKYTRERGLVRISLRDLPHEDPSMCYLEIVVEDTGVGISEEFLPRVFDEFEREQTALTKRIGGAGLGLSIVKKLVDLMHGKIEITSRVGEGTKVVVTTPHRIAERQILKSSDSPVKNVSLAGRRVLLVDDDSMTCEIVSEMLRNLGVDSNSVSDGEDCIRKLDFSAAGTYDAVLMDLRLPKMDGIEATRVIRGFENRQKATIPVFALTADVFARDLEKIKEVGMDGYITKPVSAAKLLETLSSVL